MLKSYLLCSTAKCVLYESMLCLQAKLSVISVYQLSLTLPVSQEHTNTQFHLTTLSNASILYEDLAL